MTNAELICQIIRNMTPGVRKIVEYTFPPDGVEHDGEETCMCPIIAMCTVSSAGLTETLVDEAKDRMFRMAAMARAAETTGRLFGLQIPADDAKSLDAVTRLNSLAFYMQTTRGDAVEMAIRVLRSRVRGT